MNASPVELELMCGVILGAVVKQDGQADMFGALPEFDATQATEQDDKARMESMQAGTAVV
jgi:hypothetical protein